MLKLEGRPVVAAVFDFDGVLADTADGWSRAESALCEHFGVVYTDTLAEATHGVGLSDAVRILTAGVQPPVVHDAAVAKLRALAEQHVPESLMAVKGAVATVRALSRVLPVAIASNSERPLLEHMVHRLGLAGHVRTLVSASDVAAPKPAPDVYQEAARRLGAAPGYTLAIEDSATGGAAAQAAGCVVVALALEGARWSTPDHSPPWAAVTVGSHEGLLARLLPSAPQTPGGTPGPKQNPH